ncbi:hypothetical protein WH47_04052 [Habropoda laboriosa]|uniref:THD domain-containing protein n=1 Tax=Habropoda laboriosa TaxID=597456 RepID=A0A0L7QUP0_9HYME|nr:hypothetical protein WH47_04052 [Habropoda laboriosa]
MARKIKMEHLKSDIDLHVDNPTKNAENLIEWNVDMKVTVSNVQSINVNLLLLMSKYDRLNRSLNRAWIHRSERFLENRNLHDMQRLLEEASSITKTIDIFDRIRRPLVATFVGAIPEQHITDTVYIGPWVKSTKNDTQYSLNKFHLVEDKKSIEVTVTGLYMISAQIFYFGEPTNYSYWILLNSEGKSTTQKLVKCSTASSASATEVSCYTSVIIPLQRGDRVHIQQQERDRLINMREGHSYIQLVLLSNNTSRRRVR